MHFIDSHIHLQDIKTVNATEFFIQAFLKKQEKFVCISAKEEDWNKVEELSAKFEDKIFPAIGIHPWYVENLSLGWEGRLEDKLIKNQSLLIGECGLDGAKNRDVNMQIPIFATQLALAQKYNRPLLIHSVHAVDKTLSMLKDVKVPFVWHSFCGSAETAKTIVKYGGYIGINQGFFECKHHDKVLAEVQSGNILPESDAPYQYSWETVPEITQNLASVYHVDADTFYQNFLRFINGK